MLPAKLLAKDFTKVWEMVENPIKMDTIKYHKAFLLSVFFTENTW